MDQTGFSQDIRNSLLKAALPHVPFDGWSATAFEAAVNDTGIDSTVARAACPGGALDLAVAFHLAGDDAMRIQLQKFDLTAMKIREKVSCAIRLRLEAVPDKEVVRRGAALFALPQNAAQGAQLIWGTADAIWDALGDTSDDINWYSKRAILSGVYSSTVLIWLGDDSPDQSKAWDFLDRRIEDVMRIEKVKAAVRSNPFLAKILAGPEAILSRVKAPSRVVRDDLPGTIRKTDAAR